MADRWRWIVPTCLAAAISGWLISLDKSFWYDEAFSAVVADQSLGGILEQAHTTAAVTEVGYLLLLHAWSEGLGLGYTESAVRGFSAVCAIAAVPILYAIARRLYDVHVAAVAALLMSVSPFFADYATEGRQYGLLLLASTSLVYCYLRFEAGSAWWAVGCVITGIVAMGAHWFAALVLLSLVIAALLSLRAGKLSCGKVAGFGAVALVAVLPSMALAYWGSERRPALAAVGWIPRPSWDSLRATAGSLLGSDGSWLTLLAAALALTALYTKRRHVVTAWLLAPISIAFVASFIRPMLVPRYLIISLPAANMTVAAGAISLSRRARAAAIAALLSLSAVGVVKLAGEPPRENWASVIELAEASDVPVVLGWSAAVAPFKYSANRDDPRAAARMIDGAYKGGSRALAARLRTHRRAWLVHITGPLYAGEIDASRAGFGPEFEAVGSRVHDGRVAVIITTLYERTTGGPAAEEVSPRREARASGP